MGDVREGTRAVADEIVGRLVRRHSTAVVLFHHAIGERLGLGPTDHKCLDLLRERGALTGSELAAITGLTSGAVTGVVARLEQAGYLRRDPDREDRRKQILFPVSEKAREINGLIEPIRADAAALLDGFDSNQLSAIAEFLSHITDLVYRHAALLRAQMFYAPRRTRGTAHAKTPGRTRGVSKTDEERPQRPSKNKK